MKLNSVALILTDKCNLSCSYCYERNRKYEDMGNDIFEAALKMVDKHIMIFGGEPCLRIDLIERICKEFHGEYQLVTNGTILPEKLQNLIKEYQFGTQLSIDGIPEIQKINRGKASLKAIENIPTWVSLYEDNLKSLSVHACVSKKSLPYIRFTIWFPYT